MKRCGFDADDMRGRPDHLVRAPPLRISRPFMVGRCIAVPLLRRYCAAEMVSSTSFGSATAMSSRIRRDARRSHCVRPMFMMVIGTPACAATGTMLAAGYTSSVEPMTHSSSARDACGRVIDLADYAPGDNEDSGFAPAGGNEPAEPTDSAPAGGGSREAGGGGPTDSTDIAENGSEVRS